jgi:hypothetical protein
VKSDRKKPIPSDRCLVKFGQDQDTPAHALKHIMASVKVQKKAFTVSKKSE